MGMPNNRRISALTSASPNGKRRAADENVTVGIVGEIPFERIKALYHLNVSSNLSSSICTRSSGSSRKDRKSDA